MYELLWPGSNYTLRVSVAEHSAMNRVISTYEEKLPKLVVLQLWMSVSALRRLVTKERGFDFG